MGCKEDAEDEEIQRMTSALRCVPGQLSNTIAHTLGALME